jgi:cytochrome P450/NADPH-cytochrome P450 reductase
MYRRQMITMLIAGHETTSGLLSFAIYYLLKNPGSLQKAQQEVDRTIGKGQVRYKHLSKLPFLEAVLRETLRLNPTAPFITVSPQPGTKDPVVLGGGKYVIPADANVTLLLSKIHRDPSVYGEDANEFKPERMMDEKFRQLRSGAWKPFGNGQYYERLLSHVN